MSHRITTVAVLVCVLALPGAASAARTPRASLTDVENDVMCVSCKEPLALAQSPQAESERNFIRGLISQGYTKPQIENALVAQYGVDVLGRPPASGFNLTVYVLPPALLLVGLVLLGLTLPRWRRRTAAAHAGSEPPAAPLDPREAARLEEDMARHG